jgi:hypothetical protein
MIKCGAIAAVAIAAGATGTATLVSNTQERVDAGGSSAYEQALTVRGTRSSSTPTQIPAATLSSPSRRGERPDYEPLHVTMAPVDNENSRRGAR